MTATTVHILSAQTRMMKAKTLPDHPSPLLHKLAAALEKAADPFALENARLAALSSHVKKVQTPVTRYALSEGVWLDYQNDTGVQTNVSANKGGLNLQLQDRGNSQWYSLSYALQIDALRQGRYLGQILKTSGSSSARFRICLRYIFTDGFRDVFARDMVIRLGGPQEDLITMSLDPDLLKQAQGAEVLFFFEGRTFDLTFNTIEALLI